MDPSRNERAHALLANITGSWKSQALHAAVVLGIADRLASGPASTVALAADAGADAAALHRLLQALAALEICRERPDGTWDLTQTGELLTAGAPDSLRSWVLWWGGNLWPVWGQLAYSVRTGRSARERLTGSSGFRHLDRDPESAAIFHRALVELTRLAAGAIIASYDFGTFQNVIDIGGGHGELIGAILATHPAVRGTLLELGHAISGAAQHLAAAGVAERCCCIEGDFFADVPSGGDAYVLKSVLHDWDDPAALRILAQCRSAMAPTARLLVIEQVLPAQFEPTPAHQSLARSDLTMLVAHAGQERTEGAYRALLADAGFRIARIVPTRSSFSVIEAIPSTP